MTDSPTAADFLARFPRFAGVPEAALDSALEEAATRVGGDWLPGDLAIARLLHAAHRLTLDGFGPGAEAALAAGGALGLTSVRSGSFVVERREAGREGPHSAFAETSYGRRFLALLAVNQPAVQIV